MSLAVLNISITYNSINIASKILCIRCPSVCLCRHFHNVNAARTGRVYSNLLIRRSTDAANATLRPRGTSTTNSLFCLSFSVNTSRWQLAVNTFSQHIDNNWCRPAYRLVLFISEKIERFAFTRNHLQCNNSGSLRQRTGRNSLEP